MLYANVLRSLGSKCISYSECVLRVSGHIPLVTNQQNYHLVDKCSKTLYCTFVILDKYIHKLQHCVPYSLQIDSQKQEILTFSEKQLTSFEKLDQLITNNQSTQEAYLEKSTQCATGMLASHSTLSQVSLSEL